ncbi:MAG TPA: OmpA family protein [Chitinophagaceae bacterium]
MKPSFRWLLLLLLYGNTLPAQELIVNGGFEHENICIEYEQTCSPEGWRNTAHLPFGYQRQPIKGFTGEHYLPMVVEDLGVSNFRTYWQTRLRCPLQKNITYKISFYANALGAKFIESNLALYFSPVEVKQMRVWPIKVQSVVSITSHNITEIKKSDWLKVSIEYTAKGDEQFLAVGNFNTDQEMQKHKRPKSQKVIYCVDDLSLTQAGDTVICEPKEEVLEWLSVRLRHTPVNQQPRIVKKTPIAIEQPTPAPTRIDTLVLPDVLFRFDSGSLTPAASYILDTIADRLRNVTYKRIRIEGHTDSLGSDDYNLDLSGKRARSVMQYFIGKGINNRVIGAEGKGEHYPVATNSSDEGRRKNRRVEILVEY